MASNPGTEPTFPHGYYYRRSLAAPVILIAFGVLFMLHRLHLLPGSMWSFFAVWWPLLLILAGVIRLVEYGLARREPRAPGSFGALGVTLLAVLIVAGLCAAAMRHFDGAIDFGDWDHGGFSFGQGNFFDDMLGRSYPFSQELTRDFPPGSSLKVVSDGGDISISSWDKNQIEVSVRKSIRTRNQAEANQMDAATQAQIVVNGNEVLLNANTMGAGGSGVKSNLAIYLPRNAGVTVAARHGDVTVDGRTGDIEVSASHGDVRLSAITGNISVAVRHGSMHAKKIDGDAAVTGAMDEAKLFDITGKASVDGEVSDGLSLARIGKQVAFRSSRTDLEFASLPGELHLTPDDLNARQVTGPFHLVTRSKDIHLENISGDVHVENANGRLELHAEKLPLGALELSNSNADIKLVLPAEAAFSLDATARRGDIDSDFGGISVFREHGDNRATGRVGGGGPKLEISNVHGDVEIRKS
jgi:DUF4097 and DUF4098 domain-containing protein YvlB